MTAAEFKKTRGQSGAKETMFYALRATFTTEETFNLAKIYGWFLVQIKEIMDFEEELAGAKT